MELVKVCNNICYLAVEEFVRRLSRKNEKNTREREEKDSTLMNTC